MGWEWVNSRYTNSLPVDFCRDGQIFDLSLLKKNITENPEPEKDFHEWEADDEQIFWVPIDVLNFLPQHGDLVRDIIAYLTQRFINQQPDQTIYTSYRQLTTGIGMTWDGHRTKDLDDALLFAKALVVRDMLIKGGKDRLRIFSFLDQVERTGLSTHYKTRIKINDIYADLIRDKSIPKAPIPVSAIEAANRSSPKYIKPAKNLIYRLSARVPAVDVKYKTMTLAQITGIRTVRRDRVQKILSSVIEVLYPVMISDYFFLSSEDVWQISLAGSTKKVVEHAP